MEIAYNAALQAANAALAAAGYMAERSSKHLRVIQSLEYTVELERVKVDMLDAFRRKRHIAVYEQVGAISDREASEMLELAMQVRALAEESIRRDRPELLA